jgi:hypothetical protein
LGQGHKFKPIHLFGQRVLLAISKGKREKMRMFFQNRCRALTPGSRNLLIEHGVLATIIRVQFVMLPGITMLPHF